MADWNTEDVGVEVFRETNAGDLLIAGAHRNTNPDKSADVAHADESVFEGIHEAAIDAPTEVVQPHGFSQADHPDCDEVVVSAGTAPPSPLAQRVSGSLLNAGFASVLYDGDSCPTLGATGNVQGASTRDSGASFLHVETSKPIRDDPTRRSLLTGTIADGLLPPTVTPLRPAPGSGTKDRTPIIRATVKDAQTDLAKTDIGLSIDGQQKTTFAYNTAKNRLSYSPGRKLALGRHTVKVNATDSPGNSAAKRWSFKVVRWPGPSCKRAPSKG